LGCLERVEKTLHPGFFTSRRIFLYNPFLRRGIDLFDHVPKRRFGFANFFFTGQNQKFLGAGPYRAFYRLIPKPAFLTLPVALFGGTAFLSQRNPPLPKKFAGPLPKPPRRRNFVSPGTGFI
jgi:hypothetical protein